MSDEPKTKTFAEALEDLLLEYRDDPLEDVISDMEIILDSLCDELADRAEEK